MKKIKISKLDAARRQLITAIRLYFNNGDIVSLHTLASASLKITQNICDSSSDLPDSWMSIFESAIKPEHKKEAIKKFHETANFFKHADRDTNSVHDFNSDFTEITLFLAANQYYILTNERVPEIMAFLSWYPLNNPETFYKRKEDFILALEFINGDRTFYWQKVMPLFQAELDKGIVG